MSSPLTRLTRAFPFRLNRNGILVSWLTRFLSRTGVHFAGKRSRLNDRRRRIGGQTSCSTTADADAPFTLGTNGVSRSKRTESRPRHSAPLNSAFTPTRRSLETWAGKPSALSRAPSVSTKAGPSDSAARRRPAARDSVAPAFRRHPLRRHPLRRHPLRRHRRPAGSQARPASASRWLQANDPCR